MTDTMTIQDKTYNNKGKTMTNKQWVEKNRDKLKTTLYKKKVN